MSKPREPKASPHDNTVRFERAVLGCLLETPALIRDAGLSASQFLLSDHQTIFRAMVEQQDFDLTTLVPAIGERLVVYLGSLVGHIPLQFPKYAEGVRRGFTDRQFQQLHESLGQCTNGDRLPKLKQMQELLAAESSQDWRSIFHTLAEFEASSPFSFAISGFLPCDGITLIGGLAGHSKTLTMLAMNRSLLTGEPLFGWAPFSVPQIAKRTMYLVPECTIPTIWNRIKMFRLQEFIRDGRLLVRTLSHREQYVDLNDPRILRAAEGAHVFLDTATRFMSGGEDAENSRVFANTLFQLLAVGARTVVGAHHAPKSFEESKYMTLENILRGSGDLGAMLSAGWGLRQIDSERNAIFVGNIKARDFETCGSFVIEGRPHLDEQGTFAMIEPPGRARPLREYLEETKQDKPGRPRVADDTKMQEAAKLRAEGKSLREIGRVLGVSKDTVDRLLFAYDARKDTVQ